MNFLENGQKYFRLSYNHQRKRKRKIIKQAQKFENPSNNSTSKYNIARIPSFRGKKKKFRSLKH